MKQLNNSNAHTPIELNLADLHFRIMMIHVLRNIKNVICIKFKKCEHMFR